MKKIFDFVYCAGAFTPDVVVYHVLVGQSTREKNAAAYIARLAQNSCDYLWALHTSEMSAFFDRIEDSLFSGSLLASTCCHGLLRKKFIAVTQLARQLRTLPPCLLNSSRIVTSSSFSLLVGSSRINARSALFSPCLPETL